MSSPPIDLLGVPSEAGAQNGTSGGPQALSTPLISRLAGAGFFARYRDLGEHACFPKTVQSLRTPRGKVYCQKEVAQAADITAPYTHASLARGCMPFVLGGDHSIAIGSGRGALEFANAQGKKLGLLWIDAHYDAHTHKTTHSHNANGMPLATLLGYGPRVFRPINQAFLPKHVLHLGAGETDCEPEERALLEMLGVTTISARQFHKEQLVLAWKALSSFLERVDLIWVSFDLDAADRSLTPAVHLRSDGGLTRPELLWIAGHVANSGKLCGADVVEYKPGAEEYDDEGVGTTARFAGDFLLRLLGT